MRCCVTVRSEFPGAVRFARLSVLFNEARFDHHLLDSRDPLDLSGSFLFFVFVFVY